MSKLAMALNWIPLVASSNPQATGGALVVSPGTLFPNSRGNKAAANLRLFLTSSKRLRCSTTRRERMPSKDSEIST